MTKPLVSIITVVYNSEQLLKGTIESVLNQTCKDFEFIIIDGGSTDGTLEIIQKNQHEINQWISEPDKGIYDAMNKGLKLATGEYIWFINSGDRIYSNDVISKLIDIYNHSNPDVMFGETMLINSSNEEIGTRSAMTTRKLPLTLTWKNMINGMVVSHQSIIVKKEIAPVYKLAYKCSADIDWVISCLKNAKKTVNTNLVLSSYLIGGFSIANQKRCLKERFQIYLQHYGLIKTLISHLNLFIKNIKFLILGKSNY